MPPKRVAVVGRRHCEPPIGGAAMRNAQILRSLSRIAKVDLLVHTSVEPEVSPTTPAGVENFLHGRMKRSKQLLTTFGWPVWLFHPRLDSFAKLFGDYLDTFKPGLIVFTEPNLAAYAHLVRQRNIPLFYDAHNLECFNEERLFASRWQQIPSVRLRSRLLKRAEATLWKAAASIWVCSDQERRLAESYYPKSPPIYVLPNVVDVEAYRPSTARPRIIESPKILFPASFDYLPNEQGAIAFLKSQWPSLLKKHPGARLTLAGLGPSPILRQLAHRSAGVEVTGFVPDLRPLFAESDLVIVPLLHGGGTRLKILEAFASGIPVVSSAKGAENLSAVDGKHLVLSTIDAMADSISGLIESPERRARLVEAGLTLVRENYSSAALDRSLDSFWDTLRERAA